MANEHENEDPKTSKSTKNETELTEEQKRNALLPPGSVVPHEGSAQDPGLAAKGIYQPADQAANRARTEAELGNPDDRELHENHRKNLANMPPVPSERAGAASQAK